ncbi:hypothetical protein PHET_00772 [Paragonimus heterotremus]|uniref:Ig-like domain-containing protein n=1 Tax=Paragonimus heterotremus TaxID=100268 RepID=A0A8J4SSF0_9TREM|nr:hypothetical protein PHET_00772 [Paragonimus heterotremus]
MCLEIKPIIYVSVTPNVQTERSERTCRQLYFDNHSEYSSHADQRTRSIFNTELLHPLSDQRGTNRSTACFNDNSPSAVSRTRVWFWELIYYLVLVSVTEKYVTCTSNQPRRTVINVLLHDLRVFGVVTCTVRVYGCTLHVKKISLISSNRRQWTHLKPLKTTDFPCQSDLDIQIREHLLQKCKNISVNRPQHCAFRSEYNFVHQRKRFKYWNDASFTKQDTPFSVVFCRILLCIILVFLRLSPVRLSSTGNAVSVFTMRSPNQVVDNENGFHMATQFLPDIAEFEPPIPHLPCRYPFRDDVETSALLADHVIVGWPVRTYRRQYGPLYNISLYVTRVLKRAPFSLFPVMEKRLLRIGQFSKYPDLSRCWVDVQMNQQYFFFIRNPDWAGFCQVSQLPVEYSTKAENRVKRILRLGAYPLQMRPLYHADQLEVDEGNDLMLTCQVRGRPTPLISWYHNHTEIKTPWKLGARIGVIQSTRNLSKLQLGRLRVTDAGNYTCLAVNLNGHIRKSVQIVVKQLTTTPMPTSTTTLVQSAAYAHPCHGYCYRGHCYVIDGKPYCRCNSNYFGDRCQLYYPLSWSPMRYLHGTWRATRSQRPPKRNVWLQRWL